MTRRISVLLKTYDPFPDAPGTANMKWVAEVAADGQVFGGHGHTPELALVHLAEILAAYIEAGDEI